jgi:hypothetical protein
MSLSDHKQESKALDLLDRIQISWIRYRRAYHRIIGTLEDKTMRVNMFKYDKSDEMELNEDLLFYADACIRFLEIIDKNCLFPESKKPPFVHKILREYRNINHHEGYVPVELYGISLPGNEKKWHEIPKKLYIHTYILSLVDFYKNKKFQQIVESHNRHPRDCFTEATLKEFVEDHHLFMIYVLHVSDKEIKQRLPRTRLVKTPPCRICGGGSFGKEYTPDEYFGTHSWIQNIKQSREDKDKN